MELGQRRHISRPQQTTVRVIVKSGTLVTIISELHGFQLKGAPRKAVSSFSRGTIEPGHGIHKSTTNSGSLKAPPDRNSHQRLPPPMMFPLAFSVPFPPLAPFRPFSPQDPCVSFPLSPLALP
ncbi:hypothetical protein E2C01_013390 [Portunus trituberculatus]|uniref:Uncharacterized protein n=1 Tax=Portunus trituberculatus TaxID=210409 RepID=A0A5B7DGZ4_PORTR|nr:hypothetical protein [Portunus trituberculatus]